jgi:hypothetical protein
MANRSCQSAEIAWQGVSPLRPELRPTLAPAYAGHCGGSRTPPLLNAAELIRRVGQYLLFRDDAFFVAVEHQRDAARPEFAGKSRDPVDLFLRDRVRAESTSPKAANAATLLSPFPFCNNAAFN